MVIWLVGLSGSGKTTIGLRLAERLKRKKIPVVFMDGDILRDIMGNDLGHTLEDRRKNAERARRICQYLDSQGMTVVFAILSLFKESRDWNRAHIKNYYEVFLRVSMETLMQRDPKGLYKKYKEGEAKNIAGLDMRFEEPKDSDLIIDNDRDRKNVDRLADAIIEDMKKKGLLKG